MNVVEKFCVVQINQVGSQLIFSYFTLKYERNKMNAKRKRREKLFEKQ